MPRIVVATCDRYSMLIPGFCFFLEKYWKDRPWDLDILANTPKARLDALPYNVVYIGPDLDWAGNMIAYLDQLGKEHILILLDDYYLCGPPDTETITQAMACMQAHDSIGYINLRPWSDDKLSDGAITREWVGWHQPLAGDGIEAKGCPVGLGAYDLETAEYLLSLQPGLWWGPFLKSLLREKENGWQTEIEGTKRARREGKWMLATFTHPIPYTNIARYGIWRANPDGSTSQDWIVEQVGTQHWIYKELSAALSGEGLR